jgi:hypothetical protein
VVLSPSGALLAIGDTQRRDVRFLDVASLTLVEGRTYQASGAAYFPLFSGDGTLYVPVQIPDGIVKLDVTGAPTEVAKRGFTKAECELPHEARLSADGSTLFVVCEGDHRSSGAVLALDPVTLATRGRMTVGVYPDRLLVESWP